MNRFHVLARRMRPVHQSWQEAAADLTLEQANHHERAGVLPITFSLMHLVHDEFLGRRLPACHIGCAPIRRWYCFASDRVQITR